MREILFRGKRTSYPYEGWAEGSLLCVDGHCMILEKENDDNGYCYPYINAEDGIVDGGLTTVDPETVGQYTGLTDKNGTKIFEGDILAIKFFPAYVERVWWDGPPDAIAKVFWDLNAFALYANGKLDKRYADFCDINYHETEIIGNIHDNPELLEGENTNG